MRKVIILEGCDGSGKTTLAGALMRKRGFNYNVVKTGPPKPDYDVAVAYLDAIYAALSKLDRTLFDRLHLGEKIYGPLLRGEDRMGKDGLATIERVIAAHDVALVICCPPWDALVAGWRSKDDLLKNETQLRHVYDAYLREVERLGITPYDWTALNAENVLKGLIEC
jgi:hypothetical protein